MDGALGWKLTTVMGAKKAVAPGTVIASTSEERARTNAVRRVFQAATVQGTVGVGYS